MAYEVIIKKRFTNKFQKLVRYLEEEWGASVADKIESELYHNLENLQKNPLIGSLQGRQKIRSIIFTRHNRHYYRIEKNKIVIVNLFDMRISPKKILITGSNVLLLLADLFSAHSFIRIYFINSYPTTYMVFPKKLETQCN